MDGDPRSLEGVMHEVSHCESGCTGGVLRCTYHTAMFERVWRVNHPDQVDTFEKLSAVCAKLASERPRKTIVLTMRSGDVHACIQGEPGKWGCGRGSDEAIGSLVRSWPEEFGLTIQHPEPAR